MADGIYVSTLKPSFLVPSTRRLAALCIRRTPRYISVSSLTGRKRTQCAQAALKSRTGDSTCALGGPASTRANKARKGGTTPFASSSWDGAASSEDDNNESRSGWSPRDGFGLYPWDPSWQAIDLGDLQWTQEETITLFTSEGVVKLGGSRMVTPRPSSSEHKFAQLRALSRFKRYREEDYMDPKQGLCLGAIFDIAATNGLDMGRRFCVFGFCRSIEMLSDVVKDTVLERGGEVVVAEKGSSTGLHEKLTMTVAMPALWGVPPAFDVLNHAIRSGGGIVEKTYKKWEFF